ncbi:hypothetical protein MMC22_004653 [Lobaria immixta]|nr:hypothetical protein [Lobaria immixta]
MRQKERNFLKSLARAIRDFLLAIETVDSVYANSRQQLRGPIDEQNHDLVRKIRQRTMDEEVENFRYHIRLQSTTSAVTNTRTTLTSDTVKPILKGKNQQGKDVKGKGKIETPT